MKFYFKYIIFNFYNLIFIINFYGIILHINTNITQNSLEINDIMRSITHKKTKLININQIK